MRYGRSTNLKLYATARRFPQPGSPRQNDHVVSLPRVPELRSPLARAVVPVGLGLAFFVFLGLVTWAIAAWLSSGGAETTDRLAPPRLELGSATERAEDVAEHGPLLFAELSTITGERSIVVDHQGADAVEGWRIYYAFPPGRPDCPVTQVEETSRFIDCDGAELDVTELSPPTEDVRPVVENNTTLYLDLRAFSER